MYRLTSSYINKRAFSQTWWQRWRKKKRLINPIKHVLMPNKSNWKRQKKSMKRLLRKRRRSKQRRMLTGRRNNSIRSKKRDTH